MYLHCFVLSLHCHCPLTALPFSSHCITITLPLHYHLIALCNKHENKEKQRHRRRTPESHSTPECPASPWMQRGRKGAGNTYMKPHLHSNAKTECRTHSRIAVWYKQGTTRGDRKPTGFGSATHQLSHSPQHLFPNRRNGIAAP